MKKPVFRKKLKISPRLPRTMRAVLRFLQSLNSTTYWPLDTDGKKVERLMDTMQPLEMEELRDALRPGGRVRGVPNMTWWKLVDSMVAAMRLLADSSIKIEFLKVHNEQAGRTRRDGKPQARRKRC